MDAQARDRHSAIPPAVSLGLETSGSSVALDQERRKQMEITSLTTLVTFIVALSVASERLVEIVKGWIPWLDQAKTDPNAEGRRRSVLQLLAVVSAIATAYFAKDYIPKDMVKLSGAMSEPWTILGLGLLASGGSGFWNAILTYFGKVKDLKEAEAEGKKHEVDAKKKAVGKHSTRAALLCG
jgi:hypothetical protein